MSNCAINTLRSAVSISTDCKQISVFYFDYCYIYNVTVASSQCVSADEMIIQLAYLWLHDERLICDNEYFPGGMELYIS